MKTFTDLLGLATIVLLLGFGAVAEPGVVYVIQIALLVGGLAVIASKSWLESRRRRSSTAPLGTATMKDFGVVSETDWRVAANKMTEAPPILDVGPGDDGLSREVTSWHEAGHAVAATRMGVPVLHAQLAEEPVPISGSAGWVRYYPQRIKAVRTIWAVLVATVAGARAESLFGFGDSLGGCDDYELAQKLCAALMLKGWSTDGVPPGFDSLIQAAQGEADRILEGNREEMRTVANTLEERGYLRGTEIITLMEHGEL